MQLIFVNRYFAPDESATSQLLSDLAFHLSAMGWAVHVVASRQLYEDPAARLPRLEELQGVVVHRVWSSRYGRGSMLGRAVDYLTFYVAAMATLWGITHPGDIIIAKTDPPLISVPAAMVARVRRAKLVNWLQDVFPEVATALSGGRVVTATARWLRAPRNASLRAATLNVCLGQRMAAHVRAQRVDPSQVAVIGNWADGAALKPLEAAANPLRQAWGLSDRFVVGYSGNMGRAHDFATMLAAAERLKTEVAIVFVLVGGGHRKAWIAEQVRARGLSNVVFKPYQSRESLGHSLAVPDVHLISLQPSLEGLIVPSKLYGIAAVGRPIIFVGDPAGEVAGMIEDAACGVTVAIGDGDRLADHILSLSRSAELRDRWGRNARDALVSRYDKPIALAAWAALLAGVAERPVRTPPAGAIGHSALEDA